MIIDTSKCARKIIDIHGDTGKQWLEGLPERLAALAERWSLTLLPPFEYDSYSYVAPAVQHDGKPVVLKVGVPQLELRCQIESLRLCGGDGMVLLLDADLEQCAMLMERLLPGTMLAELQDDVYNTQIAGNIMKRLWKPAPIVHEFPTVADWALDLQKIQTLFDGGYGPFPARLIDKAEGLFREFLSANQDDMLIHGDVNPFNILKASREPWLVIDPKGVVGNPIYDVATFMNNIPEDARSNAEIRVLLDRRANQFSDILGFDRNLILGWSQAHCVLASYWTFEDHGEDWEQGFAFADLYEGL